MLNLLVFLCARCVLSQRAVSPFVGQKHIDRTTSSDQNRFRNVSGTVFTYDSEAEARKEARTFRRSSKIQPKRVQQSICGTPSVPKRSKVLAQVPRPPVLRIDSVLIACSDPTRPRWYENWRMTGWGTSPCWLFDYVNNESWT